MNLTALVVIVIVFAIVAAVVFGFFEMTPFAHHATNPYRDARSGKRLWESPHLETRDEFEHRTHDSLEG